MKNLFSILSFFLLWYSPYTQAIVSYACSPISETATSLAITIPIDEHDCIYTDYISFSVDHPDIQLSHWKSSIEPIPQYSSTFKETKPVFNKQVTLSLTAQSSSETPITDAHLHCRYYTHTRHHMHEQIFPLSVGAVPMSQAIDITGSSIGMIQTRNRSVITPITSAAKAPAPSPARQQICHYSARLADYAQRLDSLTATIIFTLLIGLLILRLPKPARTRKERLRYLLFTPCFYLFTIVASPASTLYLLASLGMITGAIYVADSDRLCCSRWRTLKAALGMALLGTSLIIAIYGYKVSHSSPPVGLNGSEVTTSPIDRQ